MITEYIDYDACATYAINKINNDSFLGNRKQSNELSDFEDWAMYNAARLIFHTERYYFIDGFLHIEKDNETFSMFLTRNGILIAKDGDQLYRITLNYN